MIAGGMTSGETVFLPVDGQGPVNGVSNEGSIMGTGHVYVDEASRI